MTKALHKLYRELYTLQMRIELLKFIIHYYVVILLQFVIIVINIPGINKTSCVYYIPNFNLSVK